MRASTLKMILLHEADLHDVPLGQGSSKSGASVTLGHFASFFVALEMC